MLAAKDAKRIRVTLRDWINYRATCPVCGETIGPRHTLREYADVPPDPPYGALVKCPRSGDVIFVEFDLKP
jgi:hypothetical protein